MNDNRENKKGEVPKINIEKASRKSPMRGNAIGPGTPNNFSQKSITMPTGIRSTSPSKQSYRI